MQDLKLEKELINNFFLKDRKKRYIGFVSDPNKRSKWIEDLRDNRCLDPRYYREITGRELNYNSLLEIYHRYGVREVYMASYHETLDGVTMPIEKALKEIFDGQVCMETYAYCSKEETGFFFNHEGWFYLLSKKL